MEIKKINPTGLTISDVDKKITRVKLLIFNDENKILLCNVLGRYTFIGGHVNENETIEMAMFREFKEETGIELAEYNLEPFLKIESWNKNHFNTGKKCLSEIYYYAIHTNEKFNPKKMNLDEAEKEKNFFLKYMDVNEFYNYLVRHKRRLNGDLYGEMLYVLEYYVKNICRGKTNGRKL